MTANFYVAFLKGQQTHSIIRDTALLERVNEVRKLAVDFDAYTIKVGDKTVIVAFISDIRQFHTALVGIEVMMEEAAYSAKKHGIDCLNIASFYPYSLNSTTIKKLSKWISVKFDN